MMTLPKPSLQESVQQSVSKLHHIHHITHRVSIDSTNQEAMRQAKQGTASGSVWIADEQTAGRGRLGRTWHTMPQSLAMSIMLRPTCPAEHMPQLSLVTAVALHAALSHYSDHVRIKWPNDVWIQGKKVSGILTEMCTQGRQVAAVVLGIGVNIQAPSTGWPDDIVQQVTDVQSHHKHSVSRAEVASRILQSLDAWYDTFLQQGFAPIRQAWWQAHIASGQYVRAASGNGYIEGIAQALDDDGALLVYADGKLHRISSGEVLLSHNKG